MTDRPAAITVNGRTYAWPREPLVVVCMDGTDPAYLDAALAAGAMSWLARTLEHGGTGLTALAAMPSFTNPNNLSIATGRPPAVHGICGNYFLDPATGEAIMMNEPAFLRAPTVFQAFSEAGARCAVITAKDKLRRLLGHGLVGGVCFSAERADAVTEAESGVADALGLAGLPPPDVYSADLSRFVLAAGVGAFRRFRPDLTYLSTTDYVQHKHAPEAPEAVRFHAMMDGYFRALDELGAVLVLTADHGMNAKADADGRPNVVYAQDLLDGWLGPGRARVILPITDPYVVHHGALGSYAAVHLSDPAEAGDVAARLRGVPGIELVLEREAACARFELPPDRTGDLVLTSGRGVCIGTSPAEHDLSGLDAPLRSHGGLHERRVPFVVNRRLAPLPAGHTLRNFDALWVGTTFARPRTAP